MKQIYYALGLCILCSCKSNPVSVTMLDSDSSELIVVDESEVKETRDIYLSEIAEDFRIVRFDNEEEAFFSGFMPSFSENYIAIGKKPVKLFTKDGKYLCDIGGVGNGPGEYSSAYDVLIDEPAGRIYVAGFSKNLNCYDLKGNYVGNIAFPKPLNKGKLFKSPEGTISAVQLCFKEYEDNHFVAANFNPLDAGDSVRYVFSPQLEISIKNEEGATVGFNNEVWSYRCSDRQSFHTTFNDTLYSYNPQENKLDAIFKLDMLPERKGSSFFVYRELPDLILADIVGGDNSGSIALDKHNKEVWRVGKMINDSFFNLRYGCRGLHDGYIFEVYEPLELKEKLEKSIEAGDVADSDRAKIDSLLNTLHENDNNLLFVSKLKQSKRNQ